MDNLNGRFNSLVFRTLLIDICRNSCFCVCLVGFWNEGALYHCCASSCVGAYSKEQSPGKGLWTDDGRKITTV